MLELAVKGSKAYWIWVLALLTVIGAGFMLCMWQLQVGLGMISGGFVPNPLHEVTEYAPTPPEIGITLAAYAIGALVLTLLYKIVVGVKEEVRA